MIYKTRKSGPFMLVIEIVSLNASLAKTVEAKGTYAVEFVGPNGYLSALDYPMLGFSGVLCAVYGIFSLVLFCFFSAIFIKWKQNLLFAACIFLRFLANCMISRNCTILTPKIFLHQKVVIVGYLKYERKASQIRKRRQITVECI